MNKYTQPQHTGITTQRERRHKPRKPIRLRKYLREPSPVVKAFNEMWQWDEIAFMPTVSSWVTSQSGTMYYTVHLRKDRDKKIVLNPFKHVD